MKHVESSHKTLSYNNAQTLAYEPQPIMTQKWNRFYILAEKKYEKINAYIIC
jgi:hypothetical protein